MGGWISTVFCTVPNAPSKSKVHQIPSHPAMICSIELSHSFSLLLCSMVLPSIISLSRMLRYYRNHYSYWFFLLYCSVISRSFLNISTLSAFIFPAFNAFRFAFSQFRWSCSSIRCFDGFRWFSFRIPITSLYLTNHLSSCVIFTIVKRPATPLVHHSILHHTEDDSSQQTLYDWLGSPFPYNLL